MYMLIIVHLHKSKMTQSEHRSSNATIRIGILVLTNFIPFITSTILTLLPLTNFNMSPSIEANMAYIMFPINSCLNPLINTITTQKFVESNMYKIFLNGKRLAVKCVMYIVKSAIEKLRNFC